MPYFTTNDKCRLYYSVSGSDPDLPGIVFLNGLAQTTTYWHHQAQFFATDFRVLRYDGRAQGRSDVGGASLSPERHVQDLLALLDHVGITAARLVGLSHGAYVALAFAHRYPDRVNRLVVCNLRAGRYGDSDIVARWLQKLTGEGLASYAQDVIAAATGKTFREKHDKLIPMMARAVVARNRKAGLARQLEAMQAYPPAGELAAGVFVPAMVIYGGEDEIVPSEDARILARRMQASVKQIPKAGHSLPVEAPLAFNQLVQDFLKPEVA